MSARLGKHTAQATLQDAYRERSARAVPSRRCSKGRIEAAELAELDRFDTGAAAAMADEVVARAVRRRAGERASWR